MKRGIFGLFGDIVAEALGHDAWDAIGRAAMPQPTASHRHVRARCSGTRAVLATLDPVRPATPR
ncbi:hypothetical protein [Sphingomonas sp. PAMC 26605]|uniref:hypothetical protein n=1 Tax=Sphingomonas sp. PAMC 26605 TaxID=1112214 RepID=UPI00026CD6A0|nr:hypothetical protein [Sphingomonas sp. PAMC 26605]